MRQLFMNPVMLKELRGRMRTMRPFIILSVYLVFTAAITLLIYLAVTGFNEGVDIRGGRDIGQAIFFTVCIAALIQVCVITPSLTAGSIVGEKERQSYDLLISSLLSPWQIVLGKLVSALAFALLLVLSMVPLASLSFLFGGVSGLELLLAVVGIFVTGVLYATVGIFWSTIMSGTLAATVLSQVTILIQLLGLPFLIMIFGIFGLANNLFDLNGPVTLYFYGAVLSTHPFIALGISDALIRDGNNAFYFSQELNGITYYAPAPWIVYIVFALAMTALLLVLSVNRLKPAQEPHAPKPSNKLEAAQSS